MDLWAHINGKDYPIDYGSTFSEELGDTLDSGSIVLPHVFDILDIKPYDDIIIHDFEPNYDENHNIISSNLPNRPFGEAISVEPQYEPSLGENADSIIMNDKNPHPEFVGHFYKHMLAFSISREQVNIVDKKTHVNTDSKTYNSYVFNYSIQLISETKGLETVQLPSKSITQPMRTNENTSTVYTTDDKASPYSYHYTLPYGLAYKRSDMLKVYEGLLFPSPFGLITGLAPFQTNQSVAYVGITLNDNGLGSSASDLSSDISKVQYINERFALPDFSVSAISLAYYQKNSLFVNNEKTAVYKYLYSEKYHPHKIWIIRKKDSTYDDLWNDKNYAATYIYNYLEQNIDEQNCIKAKYESDKPYADIYTSLTEEGSYEIYLYIKPYNIYIYPQKNGITQAQYDAGVALIGGLTGYVAYKIMTANGLSDIPIVRNLYSMSSRGQLETESRDTDFLMRWTIEVAQQGSSIRNRSVTTIYEAVREAIQLYSPFVKLTDNGTNWYYKRKYSLDSSIKSLFGNKVAPETTKTYPTLREYIKSLFLVCDMIPVVHDNVIFALSLNQRDEIPFDYDENKINRELWAMDGTSYCDRIIRNYSGALSKHNIIHCYDRIGFRNANAGMMTLNDLQLELTHPIYEIKKICLCYYKKLSNENNYFLCRQDITPLVMLNAKRNLLSIDWIELQSGNIEDFPANVQGYYIGTRYVPGIADYKYFTIGYDIGSNKIGGWGEQFTIPKSFVFNTTTKYTYIEMLYNYFEYFYPYGTDTKNVAAVAHKDNLIISENLNNIFPQIEESTGIDLSEIWGVGKLLSQNNLVLKTCFFEIDYEGFISGVVQTSKDKHDGNVFIRDQQSDALSYIEEDGINQKSKVNKLGNAVLNIHSRNTDYFSIQRIAQVLNDNVSINEVKRHNDCILYRKSITVYKDFFDVTYSLCESYVLRNYFTSVYSRLRPYAMASYNEAVVREENKTLQVVLSADSQYYQSESRQLLLYNDDAVIKDLFAFFIPSTYNENGVLQNTASINYSYYNIKKDDKLIHSQRIGIYSCEITKYSSDTSVCFSVKLADNASGGVYVDQWSPTFGGRLNQILTNIFGNNQVNSFVNGTFENPIFNDLTGAAQKWLMFPVDNNTGKLYHAAFSVGQIQSNYDYVQNMSINDFKDNYLVPLRLLPYTYAAVKEIGNSNYTVYSFNNNGDNSVQYVDQNNIPSNYSVVEEKITANFKGYEEEQDSEETTDTIFQDGKEKLAVTMQLEPISEDERIQCGKYLPLLSGFLEDKEKRYDEIIMDQSYVASNMFNYFYCRAGLSYYEDTIGNNLRRESYLVCNCAIPTVTLYLNKQLAANNEGLPLNKTCILKGRCSYNSTNNDNYFEYTIQLKSIRGSHVEGLDTNDTNDYLLNYVELYAEKLLGNTANVVRHILEVVGNTRLQIYEDETKTNLLFDTGEQDDAIIGMQNIYDTVILGNNTSFLTYMNTKQFNNRFKEDLGIDITTGYNNKKSKIYNDLDNINDKNINSNDFSAFVFIDDTIGKILSQSFIPTNNLDFKNKILNYEEFISDTDQEMENFFVENDSYDGRIYNANTGTRDDYFAQKVAQRDTKTDFSQFLISSSSYTGPWSQFYKLVAYYTGSINSISLGNMQSTQNNISDLEFFGDNSKNLKPNMYWGLFDPMKEDTPYNSYYTLEEAKPIELLNITNDNYNDFVQYIPGNDTIDIILPSAINRGSKYSLRMYYYDNNVYNFVFGINISRQLEDETDFSNDYIYPYDDNNKYRIYISLLDNRSKTVINSLNSEPSYKIVNYADKQELITDILQTSVDKKRYNVESLGIYYEDSSWVFTYATPRALLSERLQQASDWEDIIASKSCVSIINDQLCIITPYANTYTIKYIDKDTIYTFAISNVAPSTADEASTTFVIPTSQMPIDWQNKGYNYVTIIYDWLNERVNFVPSTNSVIFSRDLCIKK